jgi:hypothetical protein
MTPEETVVATAIQSWILNIERADKLFSGLDDTGLQKEVAPGKNRLVYLWGHLTAVHDGMLPLLGLGARLHPELDVSFLTEADRVAKDLPSAGDLKRCWDEVNSRLLAGFRRLRAAEWVQKHNAVSEPDFAANPLRNRLAVLLSRTSHVSYHLGQAALVSK